MSNTTKFMLLIAAPFALVTSVIIALVVFGIMYLTEAGC